MPDFAKSLAPDFRKRHSAQSRSCRAGSFASVEPAFLHFEQKNSTIIKTYLPPSALDGSRRGVAQPGRAPGSGPGGQRFKSSLPDHLFSSRYAPSKLRKIPAVGKNATLFSSRVLQ